MLNLIHYNVTWYTNNYHKLKKLTGISICCKSNNNGIKLNKTERKVTEITQRRKSNIVYPRVLAHLSKLNSRTFQRLLGTIRRIYKEN